MPFNETPQSPLADEENLETGEEIVVPEQVAYETNDRISAVFNHKTDRRGFGRGAAILIAALGLGGKAIAEDAPMDLTDQTRAQHSFKIPSGGSEAITKVPEAIMPPEELELMQRTQEILFRHYISPPFLIYLRQIGLVKHVTDGLNLAIEHRHDLWYDKISDGVVEIKKRPGSGNSALDGLSIIVNSGNSDGDNVFTKGMGYIQEINGKPLANETGDVPWKNQKQYEKDFLMNYYHGLNQRKAQRRIVRRPNGSLGERVPFWRDRMKNVHPKLKNIYTANNIALPHRLNKLIHLRDKCGALENKSQVGSGRFSIFQSLLRIHIKNYKEMEDVTSGREPQFDVFLDEDYPDQYFIWMRGHDRRGLGITAEGYIMNDLGNQKWEVPDTYEDKMKEIYATKLQARNTDPDTSTSTEEQEDTKSADIKAIVEGLSGKTSREVRKIAKIISSETCHSRLSQMSKRQIIRQIEHWLTGDESTGYSRTIKVILNYLGEGITQDDKSYIMNTYHHSAEDLEFLLE